KEICDVDTKDKQNENTYSDQSDQRTAKLIPYRIVNTAGSSHDLPTHASECFGINAFELICRQVLIEQPAPFWLQLRLNFTLCYTGFQPRKHIGPKERPL